MSELSKMTIASVFAKYWDSDVSYVDGETSITKKVDSTVIKAVQRESTGCYKLLLHDLDSLSDEDSIYVAGLAGYKMDLHLNTPAFVIHKGKQLVKGTEHHTPNGGIDVWVDIVDYLREKQYALPHNGHSLFELGIAEVKQK